MEALLTKLTFAVGILLEFVILYLLVKRRLQGRFFWFLSYIVYVIIESGLRFGTAGRTFYPAVYWWTEIVEVTLTILTFRESFLNVFREYTRLRWFVAVIWTLIGAALLYTSITSLVFPPVHSSRQGAIIIDLEVIINFVLSVLIILYFTLKALFRIRGHRWESGVISGFTIYVALSVCGFLIRSIFGNKFAVLSTWLGPIGYILAAATWALELARPELQALVPRRELTVDDLTKMEQYSRVLERLFGKKP